MLVNISLYFHTLRYVKPIQIFNRLYRKIRPRLNTDIPAYVLSEETSLWVVSQLNQQSFFEDDSALFLNKKVTSPHWKNDIQDKLWNYNLHYFDDLTAFNADNRKDFHLAKLINWVEHNQPLLGDGWEPYPQSLRIVNWIKFSLNKNTLSKKLLNSLALQVHVLNQDIEYHLLGNHLLANAKALVFAGCFFDGDAASAWLLKGTNILLEELDEQVLEDGGHFELSPMYHGILLLDCLDLINLLNSFPKEKSKELFEKLKSLIPKMLMWFEGMHHADGNLAFFNDCALGVLPNSSAIYQYAESLGFKKPNLQNTDLELKVIDFEVSGYVSVRSPVFSFVADFSAIGPDYIPGHGHADALSFELCVGSQRVFVNSGTSEYGLSQERLRQRKTAAHNTVSVDALDSSVVWSGFRVAQRAQIQEREVLSQGAKILLSASHDGFKRQGVNCIHKREFEIDADVCIVSDKLIGNFKSAKAYLHLHPEIKVEHKALNQIRLYTHNLEVYLDVEGSEINSEGSTFHPEFGVCLKSQVLIFTFLKEEIVTRIRWNNSEQ